MILQSTEATATNRDATPPVQGGARDAILMTLLARLIAEYTGIDDTSSTALAGWGLPIALGVAAGAATMLRKFAANAFKT
ncbi:MAG: hypothetical protein WA001_02020 [Patescibacteria group bacterium]